jgi:hypothetical protein
MTAYSMRVVGACLLAFGLTASPCEFIEDVGVVCFELQNFDTVVDAKGKFVAPGELDVSGALSGTMDCEAKGKTKGKDGAAKISYTVKCDGAIDIFPVKGTLKCKQDVSRLGAVAGQCKLKACAQGLGCVSGPDQYVATATQDPDFVVAITLDPSPDGKKLLGSAQAVFDDGRPTLSYTVKGKYNAKKDESTLSLKPANDASKGTKVQLKGVWIDMGGNLLFDKAAYKIHGQSAKLVP